MEKLKQHHLSTNTAGSLPQQTQIKTVVDPNQTQNTQPITKSAGESQANSSKVATLSKVKTGVCHNISTIRQAQEGTNCKNSQDHEIPPSKGDQIDSNFTSIPILPGKLSQDQISKSKDHDKRQGAFDSAKKTNGKSNLEFDEHGEQILNNFSTSPENFAPGFSGKGSAASESIGSNSCPVQASVNNLDASKTVKNDLNGIVQISKQQPETSGGTNYSTIIDTGVKERTAGNQSDLRVPPTTNSSETQDPNKNILAGSDAQNKQFVSPKPKKNIPRPVLEIQRVKLGLLKKMARQPDLKEGQYLKTLSTSLESNKQNQDKDQMVILSNDIKEGADMQLMSLEDKALVQLVSQNRFEESQIEEKRPSKEVVDVYSGVMEAISCCLKIHHQMSQKLTTAPQQSMLTKRKKSGGITQNTLQGASTEPQTNSDDHEQEPIDIAEMFKLEKSKTQTKAGRKFLQPSIFQKIDNCGSIFQQSTIASSQPQVVTNQTLNGTEGSAKVVGNNQKQNSSSLPNKDVFTAQFSDFNYNLCKDRVEEHQSSMKVFNTYVQFCSFSYWGPQGGPVAPKMNNGVKVMQNEAQTSDPNQPSTLIQNIISSSQKQQKERTRFQMTAYDILFNPLRTTHPFEDWSPREIAKFQACYLMYGKNFGEFRVHLPNKTQTEIQDFYRCWKQTPYYKEWKKQNKIQKLKRDELTITEQLFY